MTRNLPRTRRPITSIDSVLAEAEAIGAGAFPPLPDEVFVRRVFLDTIGRLPTPEDVGISWPIPSPTNANT